MRLCKNELSKNKKRWKRSLAQLQGNVEIIPQPQGTVGGQPPLECSTHDDLDVVQPFDSLGTHARNYSRLFPITVFQHSKVRSLR